MATPKLGRRMLGEFLVIVVGVLVAFQVDAWSSGAADRRREQVQLSALAADFGENADRIARVVRLQEGHVAAVGTVLDVADGVQPRPTPSDLASLIIQAQMFQRFEAVTGAYDALLASGDLGLLSDPELRSELAAFYAAAGDGYEDEQLATMYHLELGRVLSRLVDTHWIVAERIPSLGFDGDPREVDLGPVLTSREFLGLLSITGALETNHLEYFRGLESRIARIVEILADGRSSDSDP